MDLFYLLFICFHNINGTITFGSALAAAGSKPAWIVLNIPDSNLSIFDTSYLPHLVAEADWILSGLSTGTIPPEVTIAIFAFDRSFIGSAIGTISCSGIGSSVWKGSP